MQTDQHVPLIIQPTQVQNPHTRTCCLFSILNKSYSWWLPLQHTKPHHREQLHKNLVYMSQLTCFQCKHAQCTRWLLTNILMFWLYPSIVVRSNLWPALFLRGWEVFAINTRYRMCVLWHQVMSCTGTCCILVESWTAEEKDSFLFAAFAWFNIVGCVFNLWLLIYKSYTFITEFMAW